MERSVLVKRLMEEHGEKFKKIQRIVDWLETAIMRMDEAINSYMFGEINAGDAKLHGASQALHAFKDEMEKIDKEIAECIYQSAMITMREIELAKDNKDELFKKGEFEIPGLYHMADLLFAILLLYWDELVKPEKKL